MTFANFFLHLFFFFFFTKWSIKLSHNWRGKLNFWDTLCAQFKSNLEQKELLNPTSLQKFSALRARRDTISPNLPTIQDCSCVELLGHPLRLIKPVFTLKFFGASRQPRHFLPDNAQLHLFLKTFNEMIFSIEKVKKLTKVVFSFYVFQNMNKGIKVNLRQKKLPSPLSP